MQVKCFGIAKDITSKRVIDIQESPPQNVGELKKWISVTYPAFKNINKCMIAVNHEYAEDNMTLTNSDEIAIIPPVSGG